MFDIIKENIKEISEELTKQYSENFLDYDPIFKYSPYYSIEYLNNLPYKIIFKIVFFVNIDNFIKKEIFSIDINGKIKNYNGHKNFDCEKYLNSFVRDYKLNNLLNK